MPPHQPLEFGWPLGGVHRAASYKEQPPSTAVDAKNVRPEAVADRRDRGGVRPAIKARYAGLGATMGASLSVPAVYSTTTGRSTINASIVMTGTISGTPSYSNNRTLLTQTGGGTDFAVAMVGAVLIDDSTSNEYQIIEWINTTSVYLRGNASAEGGNFQVKPFHESLVGGWVRFTDSQNWFRIFSVDDADTIQVIGNVVTAYGTDLVIGAHQVNMLGEVNRAISNTGPRYWFDEFLRYPNGELDTDGPWSLLPHNVLSTELPYVNNSGGISSHLYVPGVGYFYIVADELNPRPQTPTSGTTSNMIVRADIGYDNPAGNDVVIFQMWLRLSDSDPYADRNCYEITLKIEDASGTVSGQSGMVQYDAAGIAQTEVTATFQVDFAVNRWSEWEVTLREDDKTIDIRLDGVPIHSKTFDAVLPATAGTRVGVGMVPATGVNQSGNPAISYVEVEYIAEDQQDETLRRSQLIAACGGKLHRNLDDGALGVGFNTEMFEIDSDLSVHGSNHLMAAEHLQKLFIADYGNILASGAGKALSSSDVLTDATYTGTWDRLGITTDDFVCIITASDNGNLGAFPIMAIDGGGASITLGNRKGSTISPADGQSCSVTYRVVRASKVYDSSASPTVAICDSIGGDTDLGFPHNCKLIAMFQDRLFWAGDVSSPQSWYASARGNSYDYGYLADVNNPANAISDQIGDVGGIGDDITALVVMSNDYLVLGARNSLWVLRGDPGRGGVFDNLSKHIGIIDKKAWCRTPEGGLLFMSADGLYYLGPGANSVPEPVSRAALPTEMLKINTEKTLCLMEYDVEFRGVSIYLTPLAESPRQGQYEYGSHWWMSWEYKSFWPMVYPSEVQPMSIISYSPSNSGGTVVYAGTRTGAITQHTDSQSFDVGNYEIANHIIFGPFNLATDDRAKILASFVGDLSTLAGQVTWEVYMGKTPQEAVDNALVGSSPDASGSWTAGLNYKVHPRAAGGGMCIKLIGDNGPSYSKSWSLEKVRCGFAIGGVVRK